MPMCFMKQLALSIKQWPYDMKKSFLQFRDLTLSGRMAREQTDACKEVKQWCNILQHFIFFASWGETIIIYINVIFLESIIIVWFNVLQHSRTCLPRSKSSKRMDCYQHMYSKCYFLLFFEPSNRRFARKAGTSSMRQTVDLGRTTSSNYCRCAKTL